MKKSKKIIILIAALLVVAIIAECIAHFAKPAQTAEDAAPNPGTTTEETAPLPDIPEGGGYAGSSNHGI